MSLSSSQYSDKRFIEKGDWPKWPWLPVTRPNGASPFNKELGLIHVSDIQRVIVGNLYGGDLPRSKEQLYSRKGYDYPSIDALLNDGWQVD